MTRKKSASSLKQPAAIIGAGIAGIATAVRLALKGHAVTVFEAQESFGGKMYQFELPGGYRFDAGPSLFTLPQLVDDLFRLAGRDPQDHFRYERLDPITHYFFADGTRLKAWADEEKFAAEVEQKLGVPAADVLSFLQRSASAYQATESTFLHKSLHKAGYLPQPRSTAGRGGAAGPGPHGHHAPAPRQGLQRPAPGAALRPLRHLQRLRPLPSARHAQPDSASGARHWRFLSRGGHL